MSLAISPELLVALTGTSATQLKQLLSSQPREVLESAEELSQVLLQNGLLTPYQAGHISEGRGDGLMVGQYIVLDELGHGSVGMVYRVRHRIMGRLAALKVFTPDAEDSENFTRFMREIQATAQLDHPNLIKAYEAGDHHGAYFLAMEFVDGENLQERVEENGPMPLELALICHLDAAVGLACAHNLGMIHRDVKPGNIMLGKDGRVRVLDLGLVKFTRGISSMATSLDGTVRGTAAYMAPEQAISIRNADHRSDIYSLGSSLYFVLTGQPMFPEKTVMQQLLAHQKKQAPSLIQHCPNIPPALEELYQCMVAKDPVHRLQTMDAVVMGLKAVISGEPLPTAAPPPARPDPPTTAVADNKEQGTSSWKRLFPFWREKTNS